jgi:PRTRC genetic system ThiF family protein
MAEVDTSYAMSVPLLLKGWNRVCLHLVGCGGTGSWLSSILARIALIIQESGKLVELTFWDGDVVEPKNIPRQNFAMTEVGLPKAQALAFRYGGAWGIEINAIASLFDPSAVKPCWKELAIIIGCVDNCLARRDLTLALGDNDCESANYFPAPSVWHLDCGNGSESGQVLLGCTRSATLLEQFAFKQPGICGALPCPAWQEPSLLEPEPEELEGEQLSCAEIVLRNHQSLLVNQRAAVEAGDFLVRMLISKNLRKYATYFNLTLGSSRSCYISPEILLHYKNFEQLDNAHQNVRLHKSCSNNPNK